MHRPAPRRAAPGRSPVAWLFLAALALVTTTSARAQALDFPLPRGEAVPSQLAQQSWTKDQGLPQNSVNAILQAASGYVWLGTQEGLARFDGLRFEVFRTTRYPGLGSNEIHALLETRPGELWIGTQDGLARYDGAKFTNFKPHRNAAVTGDLPNAHVRALMKDADGALWVGTLNGLARYVGGRFTSYTEADGLPALRVLALATDARGVRWVGTTEGLARFDGRRFTRVALPPTHGPEVAALHLDPSGRLWVGTHGGLALQQPDGTFAAVPDPGANALTMGVSTITTDQKGTLWVGTEEHGVFARLAGRFYGYDDEKGLGHQSVKALAPDADGGLFIGLAGGGLVRLHRAPFTTLGLHEGLPVKGVLSVLEDRAGAVWMGTDGGGLTRLTPDGRLRTYGMPDGLSGGMISALAERRDGGVWAGVHGGGLCRPDGERFRCLTTADGLRSDNVYSLLDDRDGTLWIGSDAGLNRFRAGRLEDAARLHPALAHDPVTSVVQTRDGAVWVATLGSGLVRIRDGRARAYGFGNGLVNLEALTLHEDGAGTLWAGFDGGGLCRFDAARSAFQCYEPKDGLFDARVLQVLSDGRGNLWLGSNQGFVRMRLADFDRYDARAIPLLRYEALGTRRADGLRDAEANGGLQPTAFRARDGRLLFATAGGVAMLDPAVLARADARPLPTVLIEAIETPTDTLYKPTSGRTLHLAASERDLTFRVAALAFSNPERVRLRYKLDGYDQDWRTLEGTERQAVYSLRDGKAYRFHVQAEAPDGTWRDVASTAFTVAPHITERAWFWALVALAVAGLAALTYNGRVRQLKHRQAELQALVARQTADLRAREQELETVNAGLEDEVHRQVDVRLEEQRRYEQELIAARDKAEESARLKEAILNNMSHEIRTPITAILGFSEILAMEVKGDLQEFVHYIDENGKRLLHTLNGVLDLSRIETEGVSLSPEPLDAVELVRGSVSVLAPLAARKGVAVHIEAPVALPIFSDRFALERVVSNLVSNAVKFTSEGAVTVSLAAEGDAAVLRVTDTGVGIAADFIPHLFEAFKQESGGLSRTFEGSGLGLAIVQRYVASMGGAVSVTSVKGEGSTFTVRLPLIATSGDGVHARERRVPTLA